MAKRKRESKLNTWIRRPVLKLLNKYCDDTGLTRPAAIERGLIMLFQAEAISNGPKEICGD
jgi:hypothetical protein